MGLRRHDQLLQRHAEREGRALHWLQRRRSPPREHVAHAACQGNRLQDDCGGPAFHPHRGQGRRVRAYPVGLRHRLPVWCVAPHLQERLGRQAVHQRPRVRHGQSARGCDGQVDTRQGRGSLRRQRGAGAQGGDLAPREPSGHHRLVYGPDTAHHWQRHCAGLVYFATGTGQRGPLGWWYQHFPGPRQRAGCHRCGPQP